MPHLSPRQKTLLKMIQRSPYESSVKLAEELGCSRRTLESHIQDLFKKFGVGSRKELVETVANMQLERDIQKPRVEPTHQYAVGDRVLLSDPKRLGYYSQNPTFTVVELRGKNNIKVAGKWLHHWISPNSISGKIAEDGELPKVKERKRIHVYDGVDCA